MSEIVSPYVASLIAMRSAGFKNYEIAELAGVARPTCTIPEAKRRRPNRNVAELIERWQRDPDSLRPRKAKVTIMAFPTFREKRKR